MKYLNILLLAILTSSCGSKINHKNLMREGIAHAEHREYEYALEYFLEAEELKPNDKYVTHNISRTYKNIKDYKKCVEYSNKTITIDPVFIKAFSLKGNCLYKLEKHDDSLGTMKKVIELNPHEYSAHALIAKLYYISGEYKKSIYSINKFDEAVDKLDKSLLTDAKKSFILKLKERMLNIRNGIKLEEKNITSR